jgi:hypothetical protein
MRSAIMCSLSIGLCLAAAACDDKIQPTEPTNPIGGSTLQLVSVSISPSLGVVGLTTIKAHAEAKASNGDTLSYTWTPAKGAVGNKADYSFISGESAGPLTISVTDGKGATISKTLDFVNASLNGGFDGTIGSNGAYVVPPGILALLLVQTGTKVTGNGVLYTSDGPAFHVTIDPAQPGSVDASGHFTFRMKVESNADMTLTGDLVLPPKDEYYNGGYLARGQVVSGPLAGQPFTFIVHDPY